ncbi:hypothetical protein [Argonema antarcticum]|uniref:hypothetical protein n=1 Tax=Argonema antarcticum TaxID=2942763 RepID=UPI002013A9E6|nr:hypothetical protein [Argonema antarcticum]MCL1469471.1 hypothetical protein [Argonema antarcticum A004/B2]
MEIQLYLVPHTISELFVKVSKSGKMSAIEYYKLLATLATNSLNEDDNRSIKRLLHAVRRGWVQVVGIDATIEN